MNSLNIKISTYSTVQGLSNGNVFLLPATHLYCTKLKGVIKKYKPSGLNSTQTFVGKKHIYKNKYV